jgi:hypothetical protein
MTCIKLIFSPSNNGLTALHAPSTTFVSNPPKNLCSHFYNSPFFFFRYSDHFHVLLLHTYIQSHISPQPRLDSLCFFLFCFSIYAIHSFWHCNWLYCSSFFFFIIFAGFYILQKFTWGSSSIRRVQMQSD